MNSSKRRRSPGTSPSSKRHRSPSKTPSSKRQRSLPVFELLLGTDTKLELFQIIVLIHLYSMGR